jgi:hypothetical protein
MWYHQVQLIAALRGPASWFGRILVFFIIVFHDLLFHSPLFGTYGTFGTNGLYDTFLPRQQSPIAVAWKNSSHRIVAILGLSWENYVS